MYGGLRKTAWQRQKHPCCEPEESKVGSAKPCALASSLDLNLQPGEVVTQEAQGPPQPWAQLSRFLGKPDSALLLLSTAPVAHAIPHRAGILWESQTCIPWLFKIHISPSKTTNKADQGLFQTGEGTDVPCCATATKAPGGEGATTGNTGRARPVCWALLGCTALTP